MPCDQVPDRGLDLIVRIFDSEKSYDLKIRQKNLLVSGEHFGDGNDKCHLAVMKSKNINQNMWFMGNLMIQEYYVFFDATPLDEHGQHYVQVGIGRQNPDDVVGKAYSDVVGGDGDVTTGIAGHGTFSLPMEIAGSPALAIIIILLLLLAAAGAGFFYYKRKQARLAFKYAEQSGANARLASVSADGLDVSGEVRADSNMSDFE